MRLAFLVIGLPLAVLAAGLAPMCAADDAIEPRHAEHARRLKGQASVMSDLRAGRAVVREIQVEDPEHFDAVSGQVEWVGPFGVRVLTVDVDSRSGGRSDVNGWPAVLAWVGFGLGLAAGPAIGLVMAYRGP